MDLSNDSERDSYEDNEQRNRLTDDPVLLADLTSKWDHSIFGDVEDMNETGMLHYSANLLVRAYIRFRHNGIGSQDQTVVDAIAQYIGAYFDKPVAEMTNDELIAHFITDSTFKV